MVESVTSRDGAWRRLVLKAAPGNLLSLDQPIAKYFPDLPEPKRAITIEHLLTMQSGLESTSNRNYGAWVQSRNWVRYALGQPIAPFFRYPGLNDSPELNAYLASRDISEAASPTSFSALSACGIDDNVYYTPIEQILPYVTRLAARGESQRAGL